MGRYLQRIGVAPTKANVAELKKRMPIQPSSVRATFKSRGGFSDEVNVKLPKMRSNVRSGIDPVKRALEVLGTSYLETYEDIDGSAGKTALRRGGTLYLSPTGTTKTAAEQVYGCDD